MSRRALALTGLALLAAVPAARAAMDDMAAPATPVSIGYAAFSPTQTSVVTGEQVHWTNDSVRPHDVAGDDGSFDSSRMASGAVFDHRFTAPGTYTYHCSLHPTMVGRVVVSDVLLTAPSAPVGPRRPVAVRGRSGLPAGTPVTLADVSGGTPRAAGTAVVGADGRFAVEVVPTTTATYEATAGGSTSPPVTLLVLDRHVTGTVRRTARHAALTATVAPAAPGATVVLQARSREHFGWYPLLRGKLDRRSRVRFTVPLRRRLPLRVVLTLRDGATVLAASPPLA